MKTTTRHHSYTITTVDLQLASRPASLRQERDARTRAFGAARGEGGALAAALEQRVRGEVRFDEGSRALYATDGSNYRQTPIGVVIPQTVNDVIETVATARRYAAPVLARGGGTSLAGQCCNVAVVMDC